MISKSKSAGLLVSTWKNEPTWRLGVRAPSKYKRHHIKTVVHMCTNAEDMKMHSRNPCWTIEKYGFLKVNCIPSFSHGCFIEAKKVQVWHTNYNIGN